MPDNNFLEELNSLNDQQREAVTFGDGPLMIVAGAGTGKTTVLTKRVAYLILEKGVKSDEILALTFTDKAAKEMEERVDRLLPLGYLDLWAMTFHSFCDKILKRHALDIGLSNDYELLTETDAWILFRKNIDRFDFLKYYKPIGNPAKFISALLKCFSRLKDEGINPDQYLQYVEEVKKSRKNKNGEILSDDEIERLEECAKSYELYELILAENNAMDFGGLINNTIKLFKERPFILNKYRKQFKYILVDEFQDTNFNQYQLIKMLAEPNNNITVVGDDDQAIYKFRGASLSNILNFKKDYPNAKEILLTNNYRSAQDILDLSYAFIKQNDPNRLEKRNGLSKKLQANIPDKAIIEHIHALTLENEARSVVNRILELKRDDPEASFGDFAILVRSNSSAKIFNNLLSINHIPNEFLASTGLYSKDIILDLLAYLRVLETNYDNVSMYRILSMPILNINHEDINSILYNKNKDGKSVYEICKAISNGEIDLACKDKIKNVIELINKHADLAKRESVRTIIRYFLVDFGIASYLLENEKRDEISYINRFAGIVEKFEDHNYDITLLNFLEYMDLILDSGDKGALSVESSDPDTVKIMTVHASKGLEFKYVFVVSMVDKKFPVIAKSDPIEVPVDLLSSESDVEYDSESDPHLEEERRLFYVAMTRAKKALIFTSSDDYGGKTPKKLSRFMEELKALKIEEPDLEIIRKDDNTKDDKMTIDFLVDNDSEKRREEKEKAIQYHHEGKYSFTQLEGYKNCPLQYKFQHILKVQMSTGRPVFSYGKSMHATLEEFYKRIIERSEDKDFVKNKAESELESFISKDELFEFYKDKFIDEWYENDEQREEYREKGRNSLNVFYGELKDNFIIPHTLECPFNVRIGDYVLTGKIDRVDILPDGTCEIIDYKTGNGKDEKSVKKEQLMIYQIAAEQVLGLKPSKLTFYYLDDNTKVSFLGTDKQIDNLKEKIINWIQEIEKNNFEATPSPLCNFCDYRNICSKRE